MAKITVSGYVKFPETKESSKGPYATFSLNEAQKRKDGTKEYVSYKVSAFKLDKAPEEDSYVTVEGYLDVRDPKGKKWLNITANDVTVAPARDGSPKANPSAQKDPWED